MAASTAVFRLCYMPSTFICRPLMCTALLYPTGEASRLRSYAPTYPRILRSVSSRPPHQLEHLQKESDVIAEPKKPVITTPLGTRALDMLARMTGFYSRKSVLSRSALWLYKGTFDDIDYEAFFRVCKLPDSINSWFLVAHLHMWLLMVRLKREGEDGHFMTKLLVEMFWEDAKQRPRALGVHSGSLIAKTTQEWSGMFTGLIVAYEEGLLLSDRILAAAIWRNLVGDREAVDLTELETVVHYIRQQVKHMDGLDSELLLRNGKIKLLPFIPHSNL